MLCMQGSNYITLPLLYSVFGKSTSSPLSQFGQFVARMNIHVFSGFKKEFFYSLGPRINEKCEQTCSN